MVSQQVVPQFHGQVTVPTEASASLACRETLCTARVRGGGTACLVAWMASGGDGYRSLSLIACVRG